MKMGRRLGCAIFLETLVHQGNELFYSQSNQGAVAVEVKRRNSPNQFDVGVPKLIVRALHDTFDVTHDGQRFLIDSTDAATENAAKLTVAIK